MSLQAWSIIWEIKSANALLRVITNIFSFLYFFASLTARAIATAVFPEPETPERITGPPYSSFTYFSCSGCINKNQSNDWSELIKASTQDMYSGEFIGILLISLSVVTSIISSGDSWSKDLNNPEYISIRFSASSTSPLLRRISVSWMVSFKSWSSTKATEDNIISSFSPESNLCIGLNAA